MSTVFNLEPLCADYGMRLMMYGADFDDYENVINKSLGILVENGLYAMSVFLLSCNKPHYGQHVLRTLNDMCSDENMPVRLLPKAPGNKAYDDAHAQLSAMRSLTASLDTLILTRKMVEQALTFGRYHCKALKKEGKS